MADRLTKRQRSYVMSRIKGKNTGIELAMGKILSNAKIRYRKHPKMAGNPDFVLTGSKVLVFCDGEFWHGKDYHKRKRGLPQYWKDKIRANMVRDRITTKKLIKEGWIVVRFWGIDILENKKEVIATMRKILSISENQQKRLCQKRH